MVTVEFLGPIQRPSITIDASTLEDVSVYLRQDESVLPWLASCAVAVNDTIVSSKDITLKDGDKITLLPPVCGG